VNGLTSYSDIVLINNNENSQYKSIPWNTLLSAKVIVSVKITC
jgi:hypothetical protein